MKLVDISNCKPDISKKEDIKPFVNKLCSAKTAKNLVGKCMDQSNPEHCKTGRYHDGNCKGPSQVKCCIIHANDREYEKQCCKSRGIKIPKLHTKCPPRTISVPLSDCEPKKNIVKPDNKPEDEDDPIPSRHATDEDGDDPIPSRHATGQQKPSLRRRTSWNDEQEDDAIPMRHTSSFLDISEAASGFYDDSVDDLMTLIELTNLRHLRKNKGRDSGHSTMNENPIDTALQLNDNLLSASASCIAP
jgi:hypothetical protein